MGMIMIHHVQYESLNTCVADLLCCRDYAAALKYFNQSLQIRPKYVSTELCRIYSLIQLHKLKEAIRECSKVIHHDPSSLAVILYRSTAFARLRDMRAALKDMLHAVTVCSQMYPQLIITDAHQSQSIYKVIFNSPSAHACW